MQRGDVETQIGTTFQGFTTIITLDATALWVQVDIDDEVYGPVVSAIGEVSGSVADATFGVVHER